MTADIMVAIEASERNALEQHRTGSCHLSEWSCSHCELSPVLAATSTDGLLDALIRLTHIIHAADPTTKAQLRNQRDLVRAEILRRTT